MLVAWGAGIYRASENNLVRWKVMGANAAGERQMEPFVWMPSPKGNLQGLEHLEDCWDSGLLDRCRMLGDVRAAAVVRLEFVELL